MIGDDAISVKQFFLDGSGRRKRQTDAVVTVRPRTAHRTPPYLHELLTEITPIYGHRRILIKNLHGVIDIGSLLLIK